MADHDIAPVATSPTKVHSNDDTSKHSPPSGPLASSLQPPSTARVATGAPQSTFDFDGQNSPRMDSPKSKARHTRYGHFLGTDTTTGLTFYQRYFTKPTNHDPQEIYKTSNRRFALLSIGSLVSLVLVMLIIIAIICAVLATVLGAHGSRARHHPSPVMVGLMDNFPDPALWRDDNGIWYAFATNDAAGILAQPKNITKYAFGNANVQLATSPDFVNWTLLDSSHDPLPIVGDWVAEGLAKDGPTTPKANVWAPDVLQRPSDGKFVLYYSAQSKNLTHLTAVDGVPRKRKVTFAHCVGAAVSNSSSVVGPYSPENGTIACPLAEGGAIDPAGFVDKDGTVYVSYKVDGNNIGYGGVCGNTKNPIQPTPIRLQRMLADAITPDGDPITLLDRNESDGPLIEAPDIIRSHEGIYFLFFSSGCTRAPSYDVKYATASNVTGPYTRAPFPLLQTGDWGLLAPGSVGIHDNGVGGYNMAFQSRISMPQGRVRAMFSTELQFNGTMVQLMRDMPSH